MDRQAIAVDGAGDAMGHICRPVLVVRGADGSRPGEQYRIGDRIDQQGSPALAEQNRDQCGKRYQIECQANSDEDNAGCRKLISNRKIRPDYRKNEQKCK